MKIIDQSFEILEPFNLIEEAKLIEKAGRVCYKSENRITDDSYKRFLKMLVDNEHEAMLEHSKITVKFITDRGVSHEFVRHRIASFAQESTRYCNYGKDKFNNELVFVNPHILISREFLQNVEDEYLSLIWRGVKPQDARDVLPNCLKTELVVTANFKEWRHIFKLRCLSNEAHPKIKALLRPFYEYCKSILPEVFDLEN